MTAIDHALLDRDGRLVSADGRMASLNAAAGGAPGAPIAVPAVAAIARLSRRLGIRIARPATIAGENGEVRLWVRAVPDNGGTRIELSDGSDAGSAAPVEQPIAFRWETDSTLSLSALTLDGQQPGEPLTRLFQIGGDDVLIHILSAAANRADFTDQPARLRGDGREVRLSGTARVDGEGRFVGFVGTGRFVGPTPSPAPDGKNQLADGFTDRLDRALRSPLEQIVVHADSIGAQGDGPIRAEYVEYAHDIAGAARHLMGVVDDLVDLSAIERPGFHVDMEPLDLADIGRRAAGMLAMRASDGDVRIERPSTEIRLPAQGESRRVLQILVNLIGNAVRYSPPGSVVTLTSQATAAGVSIAVADQGRGIAIEDQERIFDKFGRVDPSEPGGNGLGLYIARRLARAMGGDITLDSAPGRGARFTLTLRTLT